MTFLRHIQWHRSHADPIWPVGTFNEIIFAVFFSCTPAVLPRYGAAAAHLSGDAGGNGGAHRRGRS